MPEQSNSSAQTPRFRYRKPLLQALLVVLVVAAIVRFLIFCPPPQALQDLLERNPETAEFVEEYRFHLFRKADLDLSADVVPGETPHFLQWDLRWGYAPYGGSKAEDMIGLSGCGPTALSMVTVALTGDTSWNPKAVADYSVDHGHYADGYGTAWTLMSQGSADMGLVCREIPLDENAMAKALTDGDLLIASVGKGDFTKVGHFIVLCGWTGEAFEIRDPNSVLKTQQLWDYETLKPQIVGLWAFSAA